MLQQAQLPLDLFDGLVAPLLLVHPLSHHHVEAGASHLHFVLAFGIEAACAAHAGSFEAWLCLCVEQSFLDFVPLCV